MCVLAALVISLAAGGDEPLLAARLERSLVASRGALVAGAELAGARSLGEQALAALVALRAGAPLDDPRMESALRTVFLRVSGSLGDAYGSVYLAGVVLMLFEELGERSRAYAASDLVGVLSRRLLELQDASGGWGDMSRTEFAALGLDAAERLGAQVTGDVWRRAVDCVTGSQHASGGWGYRPGDAPTGSMTAAALVVLHCGGVALDAGAVGRGTAWLERAFRVDANPGVAEAPAPSSSSQHRFYFLAALSSLSRACGRWPDAAWARAGAERLVDEQAADGSWAGDAVDCPTAFATQFLVDARRVVSGVAQTAPVAIGIMGGAEEDHLRLLERALSRAAVRWSGLGAGVACADLDAAPAAIDRCALVIVSIGPGVRLEPGLIDALGAHVCRGGVVLVEGQPGARPEEAVSAATRIARAASCLDGHPADHDDVVELATRSVRQYVPDGAASPPRLMAMRGTAGGVLVAPDGLFLLVGAADLGVRSGIARSAVNIIVHALGR